MNENLDLTKILDGCPEGTKLYSPLLGEVEFVGISDVFGNSIIIKSKQGTTAYFSKEGYYFNVYEDEECLLFPSKEQRCWSKFERFWDKQKVGRFDPKTLQPFDRVLAKGYAKDSHWIPTLFGFLIEPEDSFWDNGEKVVCLDYGYNQCIPYCYETKYLVGTNGDCPEYYKWWEK